MKRIENVMHRVKCSSTGGRQKFSETLRLMGRKFFKRIAINLPPIKDNEINTFNSGVQNHVPHTGSHKRFLVDYGLYLETAGNIF